MPKVDSSRNYYADLEVSPNASTDEIKKQFRKLALKYHPDRNPGKEADVNHKFQVIQSAHEILTDDTSRKKYDEVRHKGSRYPTASGVRGNPWQDAAKGWPPPPPRRTAAANASARAQTRPSGASRYASFANGTSAGAKPAKEDPDTRRWNYQAWESMRPGSRRSNPPPTPGRVPTSAARDTKAGASEGVPRTASQRQKAQASFGNSARRHGFTPRSPALGDEPPVTNKNYFTTRTHSSVFNGATPNQETAGTMPPDPLAQFRERFMDERQSSPYRTPGGEKTRLFDESAGLGRTRSAREPNHKFSADGDDDSNGAYPFPRSRARSTSTPRSSSNDGGSEDSTKVNTGVKGGSKRASQAGPFRTRTSDRYQSKTEATDVAAQPSESGPEPSHPFQSHGTTAQSNGGPSMYALRPLSHTVYSPLRFSGHKLRSAKAKPHNDITSFTRLNISQRNGSSSGAVNGDQPSLSIMEKILQKNMEHLISKKSYASPETRKPVKGEKIISSDQENGYSNDRTNNSIASSFHFSAPPNSFTQAQEQYQSASKSTDHINTRFVQEDNPDWHFTAGDASSGEAFSPTKARSQPGSRPGRRSPTRPTVRPRPASYIPTNPADSEDAMQNETAFKRFSAGEWKAKIGSQHFVPQPSQNGSNSPTRRTNSKRNARPVKMTMGTAGMVDDDESSTGEGWQEIPKRPQSTSDGPSAMDIDSPPIETAEETPNSPKPSGVRNIHVEPHRPEWRAGNVDSTTQASTARPAFETDAAKAPPFATQPPPTPQSTAASTANPFSPQNGGSEDTDLRASFADFKKVEPFIDPKPTGLKSFADLKSTLPFESRPSESIPLEKTEPTPAGPLNFPQAPVAPRLPPTMAVSAIRPNHANFRKYSQDFFHYMEKWEDFNQKVLDHFNARQAENRKRREQHGVAWLDGISETSTDVAGLYEMELGQDADVRRQWENACEEHQLRIKEFRMFRDRVK